MAPRPSKRQQAAAKGVATRKRNALFAKRSAAAKKGWTTRRRNAANEKIAEYLTRPGGKNLLRGHAQPYVVQKFGITFRGQRFDFRGLNQKQRLEMRQKMLDSVQGHYIRMLVVTNSEAAYRHLTTSGGRELAYHLNRQKPGEPYWFWTPEYGPIESSLELYQYIYGDESAPEGERGGFFAGTEPKEVKIMVVEVL